MPKFSCRRWLIQHNISAGSRSKLDDREGSEVADQWDRCIAMHFIHARAHAHTYEERCEQQGRSACEACSGSPFSPWARFGAQHSVRAHCSAFIRACSHVRICSDEILFVGCGLGRRTDLSLQTGSRNPHTGTQESADSTETMVVLRRLIAKVECAGFDQAGGCVNVHAPFYSLL